MHDVALAEIHAPKHNKQLLLQVYAETAEFVGRKINILVDTGAEINLIRPGLFPHSCFLPAQKPAELTTANGTRLEGGSHEIVLHFDLRKIQNGVEQNSPARCQVVFHSAEIQVDAIIGYPWLYYCQVGVFPSLGALAIAEPFTLLYGLRWNPVQRKSSPDEFSTIPFAPKSQNGKRRRNRARTNWWCQYRQAKPRFD